MKPMATDDQLRTCRDKLLTLKEQPRAWRIKELLQKDFNIGLDESTIRGRFIQMGEPLRGGTNTVTPSVQVVEEESVQAAVSVKEFQIDDELKKFIPSQDEFSAYVMRPIDTRLGVHYDIGSASGRHKYPITQGKQGTGKTFSHAYYAYQRKLPFFLFSCYEDMKLKNLFGDKTIKEGNVVYQESLMVRAIQSPSVILFDEVNAMSNTHTFDFHALLQNRELFIKDANDGKGHVYKLHPECRIGFAQNPKSAKYIGGNIKPSNFLGRCTFLTYPEFTEEEIKTAMKKKFSKVKPADIDKFVIFYFASVKLIEQADLPLDISIRQLINVIDLWHHGLAIKDAIDDGMASMTEAISQPKAKESFYRVAQGVWKELMAETEKKP